jgi:hypothetical protein
MAGFGLRSVTQLDSHGRWLSALLTGRLCGSSYAERDERGASATN